MLFRIKQYKRKGAHYDKRLEKEKSNLNINSCLNYIKKEANRLEERHLEMLRTLAAENMEHDSTKERFRALLIILGLPVRLVICRILT